MTEPEVDRRIEARWVRDEEIAGEPQLEQPRLPPDAIPSAAEVHLARVRRRLLAVAGIVENGLVRPLDPAVKLPEYARVIIVASEGT